jgi:hypothetical protein
VNDMMMDKTVVSAIAILLVVLLVLAVIANFI